MRDLRSILAFIVFNKLTCQATLQLRDLEGGTAIIDRFYYKRYL